MWTALRSSVEEQVTVVAKKNKKKLNRHTYNLVHLILHTVPFKSLKSPQTQKNIKLFFWYEVSTMEEKKRRNLSSNVPRTVNDYWCYKKMNLQKDVGHICKVMINSCYEIWEKGVNIVIKQFIRHFPENIACIMEILSYYYFNISQSNKMDVKTSYCIIGFLVFHHWNLLC